jgi:hypothetical protein
MGEAVVPVTRDRRILGPSILNFDERGQEYLPRLFAELSDERLYAINGNTLGNHYSLTKLMWIQEHQPELYERADYFRTGAAFGLHAGGRTYLDYSWPTARCCSTWNARIGRLSCLPLPGWIPLASHLLFHPGR